MRESVTEYLLRERVCSMNTVCTTVTQIHAASSHVHSHTEVHIFTAKASKETSEACEGTAVWSREF